MKEDWTNKMKHQLEGHKMAPPTGLWEDISSEMAKPFGLKPHSRFMGIAQRYWAAATVLVLVGVFTFSYFNQREPALQVVSSSLPVSQPAPQSASESATQSEPEPMSPSAPQSASKQTAHIAYTPPIAHITPNNPQEPTSPEASQPSEQPAEAPAPQQPATDTPQQQRTAPITVHHEPQYEPIPKRAEKTSKWSVGINASGGLLAANNTVRNGRLYRMVGDDAIYGSNYAMYETGPSILGGYSTVEYVWKHRLPVRFGLSLHYQLSNSLALLGGINYTYLSSDCSIPLYQNVSYSQQLHYLGVPLGIAWQVWSTGSLSVYLSGSAMVEKCLNANISDGSSSIRPWQWSVNASAGAEYSVIRQLGIYLEPSLGYYFDDGTSLEHYYKEHPLAPSIEFGLRFHLTK